MSAHTITIEFENEGMWPTLSFKCTAPGDAVCRTQCEQSECEEGCVDPDNHPRVPSGYCNECEWLNSSDEPGGDIAGRVTSVTVPIDIVWDGRDWPVWKFAPSLVPADKPLFEVSS